FHSNPVRLGYRKNFMHCANLCAGDLIAFCDQDDIWRADKLETQFAKFNANARIMLSFHNADLIDADGQPTGGKLLPINHEKYFDINNCGPFLVCSGFTQLFKKQLLLFSDLFENSRETTNYNEL